MMATRKLARTHAQPQWWLADASEVCPACHQTYAYQTQSYCVVCDEAVCSVCVESTISIEWACQACIESQGEE
jgi:hypothetical protein